jgi:hypothetical protein
MARKKSSAKRNSGSAGKTPEKPGKELENNENSDHRRSRRLAAVFYAKYYTAYLCTLIL